MCKSMAFEMLSVQVVIQRHKDIKEDVYQCLIDYSKALDNVSIGTG